MNEVQQIRTPDELHELAAWMGVRNNWHEPDEQDVSIEFAPGLCFDNAMTSPDPAPAGSQKNRHEALPWEDGVYIIHKGRRIAYVNMALLFAWAAGWDGKRGSENAATQSRIP